MSNLAVKYRPKTFEEVTEQTLVVKMLDNLCKSESLDNRNFLLIGPAGCGKAQPLYSKVLTPSGFVNMGDIRIGSEVFTSNGNTGVVSGVYPQGKRPIYEITLQDKTRIRVSDEHLNVVYRYNEDKKCRENYCLTTLDLINLFESSRFKLGVDIPEIDWNRRNVPIDPYLLGILIADGSLHDNFQLSNPEKDICEKVNSLLNEIGYYLKDSSLDHDICLMDFDSHRKDLNRKGRFGYLKKALNDYDLLVPSKLKYIPDDYLYNSKDVRIRLLQGLFDGDGYINEDGSVEYTTSSERLSEDFAFLVRSLGIRDTISVNQSSYKDSDGRRIMCGPAYTHHLKVTNGLKFYSSVKHSSRYKDRQHQPMRNIVSIEYVGLEECQCIMIDHPDHTYISDGFIPTHNTTSARIIANVLNGGSGEPIEIDAASHNGVDSVREIVQQARAYPVGCKYKVFIMDEVHSFSNQAWQVLLKTLEEGPAKSVFIMCLDEDGWVNTDHGMTKIRDVHEGDRVWDGCEYRSVLNVFDNGLKDNCLAIKFKSGNVIRCTDNHQILTLSGDSERWISASDISVGDVVLRYNNVNRNMWGVDDISEDEAFLLGYLTGNGNYDDHAMHLYTPYHKWSRLSEVLDRLIEQGIIKNYVQQSQLDCKDNVYVTRIHFNRNGMNSWYAKVGADPNYRRGTKSVPASVFKFNDIQLKAFVDGWYFADGCGRFESFFEYRYGSNGYSPYIYSNSFNMISDLSHLLESHGYFPSLRTAVTKGEYTPGRSLPDKEVTSYTLYLNHKPGYFNSDEFRTILQEKYRNMPIGKYKLDLSNLKLPNRRISPKMLSEAGYEHFNSRGSFDTVVAIDKIDPCHVYDIEIESSHKFIYNGVCVHNCTTNPEKIPATIISRVQTFQLSKISLSGISSRLKYVLECEKSEGRNITYEDNAINFIAKLANGGMRDALTLLDKALAYTNNVTLESLEKSLGLPNYDDYFALLQAYAKHDNTGIASIIDTVYNSGVNFIRWFEGFHSFVMNVVKYIFMQNIESTMIPSYYSDKISKYGTKHAVICLRLANKLIELNFELRRTQYLQEMALTYLCSIPKER